GEKSLFNWQNQAILTSPGTPLGECRFVTENLGVRTPSPEGPLAKLILPQRDILIGQVATFKATFDRLS
ncbi:hypothetical protein PXK01_21790, partial [Phaeobacter sp. PT47_59]|uniref:hypothetical protein n=1 Tax=Phaeobacter sp. PT47_59 TaxID=3029979 RepID=UPI0023800400